MTAKLFAQIVVLILIGALAYLAVITIASYQNERRLERMTQRVIAPSPSATGTDVEPLVTESEVMRDLEPAAPENPVDANGEIGRDTYKGE